MRTGAVRRAALVTAVLGMFVAGCGGSTGGSDSVEGRDEATSAGPLEPWGTETPENTPSSTGSSASDGPSGGTAGPTGKKGATGPPRDVRSSAPATDSSAPSGPPTSGPPASRPPATRTPTKDAPQRPAKKCGITPPTGTTDGRRAQTVVFPELGTHHTFPHTSAALRGCATSGLPVVYTIDDAAQSGCGLEPAENPTLVRLSRGQTAGRCTVVASQPGDGTWAQAQPVRQRFAVDLQPVALSWADPQADLRYPGTLSIRVRLKSPDPLDASLYIQAVGSCDFDGNFETYVSIDRRTLVAATVTARDPGPSGKGGCELSPRVVSDHTYGKSLTSRTYTVTASLQ